MEVNTLIKKYPKLFEHLNNEGNEMRAARMFGIECGDGWYDLLDTLMRSICFNIEHNKMPEVHVAQIKEKFGGLCFYYDGGNERTRGMVSIAESMSYKICENCGSNHNVTQTKGWIRCLCEKCMNEYNENKGKL
jgi:hypothetical protein